MLCKVIFITTMWYHVRGGECIAALAGSHMKNYDYVQHISQLWLLVRVYSMF